MIEMHLHVVVVLVAQIFSRGLARVAAKLVQCVRHGAHGGIEMRSDRTSRRRKMLIKSAISCAVIAAIVGGAFVARAWRRANLERMARDVGFSAFERGDWNEAIRNLGVLVARKTADPSEMLAFAAARLRMPREGGAHVAQAVSTVEAARVLGADPAECDRLLLEAYVEGGMLAEAQREAEAVLARDERNAEARRVFVHASIARGRLDEAERVLRRAVELEPRSLPNRIALAGVLAKRVREGALDQVSDAARARAVHAEISAWASEPDAPAGMADLAHAVALELGCEAPAAIASRAAGAEVPAHTLDEAELRAGLLDAIDRRHEADQLLAQLRREQPLNTAERREIARIEFRRAIFAGDTRAARVLLEGELTQNGIGESVETPLGFSFALDVVIRVIDGREDEVRALISTSQPTSREIGAWTDALRAALDGASIGSQRASDSVDVVAEAALRLAQAHAATQQERLHDALRLADEAVVLGRGRFDTAEAIAIEALARLGRVEEALVRSTRLAHVSGGRSSAVALRLWCESRVRASVAVGASEARGLRTREAIISDARAILASPDADLRASMIAAATLGSAGYATEAADSYRRFAEGSVISAEDCVALAECAVVLARAFDDASFLRSARTSIARMGPETSADVRWALAWINALEAERAGDAARGFALLREAGESSHARLAIAGEFGDAREIEGALDVLRASLPEGALIAVRSSAALRDPQLALAALAALEPGADRRTVALAHLRIATAHPAHVAPNDVLARAADARRMFPLDAEIPAAIAGFLLTSSSPDPAQALLLLGDAIRLSPEDHVLRERAAHVALLAGEPQLSREYAESLPTMSRARRKLLAAIAVAQGDGRTASEELLDLDETSSDVDSEIAALRALALILTGGSEKVDVRALDGRTVRAARMIPRADHRALVVRCAGDGVDPILVAHLAAEYLHRAADEEVALIARSAASHALNVSAPANGSAGAIAAYRASVACGDTALEARARTALAVPSDGRASIGLRREEAIAWLARDPARARRIALELLAVDIGDHESALIAAASAIALQETTPADADRISRAPRTPESHLIEARMALLQGLRSDARRAARDGLALTKRRSFVSLETREALQAIADGEGTLDAPAS